jgi:glutamine synthetase
MADQLNKFKTEVDALIKKGKRKEEAILSVLKTYYKTSKNILFEGNGYSDEWVKEAEKRGLSNVKTTPEALNAYITKESADLFTRNNIFSKIELEARYEIMQELYVKKIDIEAKTLSQLATSHVIPAAVEYQSKLAINVQALKGAGLNKTSYETQLKTIESISKHIKTISDNVDKIISETEKAHHAANTHKAALAFCHKVKPLFDNVRGASDSLEFIVDDTLWQLPKYREMLFIK